MAITGPIYWNGTNFPSQAGDPVAITQTEFECCCCDTGPCDCCSGTQPSATVTVNACDPTPDISSGTYTFSFFSDLGSVCLWFWEYTDGSSMDVRYSNTSESYTIILSRDGFIDEYELISTNLLSCVDGVITGSVTLASVGTVGCTADVTFG